MNQHKNNTYHVQSLEKDFYIGTPNFFDHVFTHMSNEQINTFN